MMFHIVSVAKLGKHTDEDKLLIRTRITIVLVAQVVITAVIFMGYNQSSLIYISMAV